MTGLVLLLEAADGGYADDPADAEGAEGVHVRAVVELVRHDAMAAAVAGQEVNLPAGELAGDDAIAGRAEGGGDGDLGGIGEAVDLVKAAAADDADGRREGGGWWMQCARVVGFGRRERKIRNQKFEGVERR